tara:strand:+ start:5672 stop:6625 length:954 start_codon:yes stop_codon:yes gene_type:complete
MAEQPLHYLNVVLNSIAGAGDANIVGGHILQITNCPDMDVRTLNIPSGTFEPSLVSVASSFEWTPTVNNSEFYQVTIAQQFEGQGAVVKVFEFTSSTSSSATEICDAFRAIIALEQSLSVTLGGTVTLEVTAIGVSSAILTVTCPTGNGTIASLQTAYVATGVVDDSATPISVSDNPNVPATYFDGVTATVSASSDTVALPNGNYRISNVVALTSFDIDGTPVGVAGVAAKDATFTLVPQFQRGNGDQLIAAGITDAVSGDTYTTWTFLVSNIDPTANQGSEIVSVLQLSLYLNETDADFAALQTQIISLLTTAGVI